MNTCGRLTLADCQVPTKLLSYSLFSSRQGKKIMMKSLWVEIGQRDDSLVTITGKTDPTWEQLIYFIAN